MDRAKHAAAREAAAQHWSSETANPRKKLSWGHFPTIKRHACGLIDDEPSTSVTSSLINRARKRYGLSLPIGRAISVGCGAAGKEIGLAAVGLVDRWDCFEISDVRVAAGKSLAAKKGLGDRVNFRTSDAFAETEQQYDMVFWSMSLHHMFDIEQALRWSLDRVAPGGIFVMDEFVGPNRFQWTDDMLQAATDARHRLDDRHLLIPEVPDKRYPRTMVRPDPNAVIAVDPTESVASEEIPGKVRELMPGADLVHLGGVVYHVALSGILTNFSAADEPLLQSLLAMDASLIGQGLSVLAGATYQKPM